MFYKAFGTSLLTIQYSHAHREEECLLVLLSFSVKAVIFTARVRPVMSWSCLGVHPLVLSVPPRQDRGVPHHPCMGRGYPQDQGWIRYATGCTPLAVTRKDLLIKFMITFPVNLMV